MCTLVFATDPCQVSEDYRARVEQDKAFSLCVLESGLLRITRPTVFVTVHALINLIYHATHAMLSGLSAAQTAQSSRQTCIRKYRSLPRSLNRPHTRPEHSHSTAIGRERGKNGRARVRRWKRQTFCESDCGASRVFTSTVCDNGQ